MTATDDTQPLHHSGRTIRAEMRTTASPHQVWTAWTDPDGISAWFTDRAAGAPTVGSTFTWFWDEMGMEQPFEVVVSDFERRFAMTLEVPGHGLAVIEVQIAKEGGATVLRLINSGFNQDADFDEEYRGMESGWSMALASLKHYLEHHAGKSRTCFMVMRTGHFDFADVIPFHRTEDGLARWLTESGAPGDDVGSQVSLQLQGGGSLTGSVLARTDRETALSWEELSAVVELKAFSCGPAGQALALRVSAWDLDAARATATRTQLQAALGRLAMALGV